LTYLIRKEASARRKALIATSTWAMLIVVVPVILLTLYFAWRYRASNRNATYAPHWSHSTAIEVVIWTVPTLIILFLGVLTWRPRTSSIRTSRSNRRSSRSTSKSSRSTGSGCSSIRSSASRR
jgi:heme/copper-type cytochrome/quinol oxidase subunit 2